MLTQTNEVVSSQTVWEFLSAGGPIMLPIALCSVIALAFTLERWLRLRRSNIHPNEVQETLELVRQGQLDEANRRCTEQNVPSARILLAGLRRRGLPLADIERAMEDQGEKEIARLQANIRPLTLIATVTPLLGLLGTVIGIQSSFHLVVKQGLGKPEQLAGGIEVALVTTIAGLCVAIPTLLLAAWLHGRVRRLILTVDDELSPLVEHLACETRERHAA